MAVTTQSEPAWSVRRCAIDARLELEHYLRNHLLKSDADLVVLTVRRRTGQEKATYHIQFERQGTQATMTNWRELRAEPAAIAPSAEHLRSTVGSEELGAICEIDLAVDYGDARAKDPDSEARLLARTGALVTVVLTEDVRLWLHESQRANCYFTLLQCVLRQTQTSSAVLWFAPVGPARRARSLTALAVAGFRTRHGRGIPTLNASFGKGVVGRAVEAGRVVAERLGPDGAEVMNPDLVKSEGWCSCVVIPLLFDSECVGAVSVYDRSVTLEAADIVEALQAEVPVATLCAARASRDNLRKMEADNMMTGAMRLQAGLTMVGLVHDLARHARDVHSWADTLRGPLKEVSLKAGVPETVDDMITSADLVGKIASAMDKLTLGRDDHLVRVEIVERLTELEPVLKRLDKAIEVNISGRACVRGPSSLIERLVFNLVMNSLHWTSRERREISVNFRRDDYAASAASLSVIDNGQGMTAEQIETVRDAFVSYRENGSGLGLFLVDKLCKDVGARLSISSQPYQRTTVEILFERLED